MADGIIEAFEIDNTGIRWSRRHPRQETWRRYMFVRSSTTIDSSSGRLRLSETRRHFVHIFRDTAEIRQRAGSHPTTWDLAAWPLRLCLVQLCLRVEFPKRVLQHPARMPPSIHRLISRLYSLSRARVRVPLSDHPPRVGFANGSGRALSATIIIIFSPRRGTLRRLYNLAAR
jgi:hypothetical protein